MLEKTIFSVFALTQLFFLAIFTLFLKHLYKSGLVPSYWTSLCSSTMCVLPPTWLCLLLGLLPLEVQTRVLTVQRAHTHRLSSSRISYFPKPSHPDVSPTSSDLSDGDQIPEKVQHIIWRTSLSKDPTPEGLLLYGSQNHRGSRGRRHASGARGHGQLMRVGCVLGTCQVQNLSHRLYQLIGQSGREDSSPINPRSPHSYG